jgi:hypothetical protein
MCQNIDVALVIVRFMGADGNYEKLPVGEITGTTFRNNNRPNEWKMYMRIGADEFILRNWYYFCILFENW